MRLKLSIAYDGRPYRGWATQPEAGSVQDCIEAALAEVAKTKIRIHGSGRTDSGVHAEAQVAHFDSPSSMTMNPYNWVPALNTKLPATIRVIDSVEAHPDFHARFSVKSKVYTYDLCMLPVLPPMLAGRAWHLPRQLDLVSLEQALELMVGERDFRGFAAKRGNETSETSYVRRLFRCDLERTDTGYRITYQGEGFLYKMARLLTGAAVYTAQGRLSLAELEAIFKVDDIDHAAIKRSPFCSPPDGLTLHSVDY